MKSVLVIDTPTQEYECPIDDRGYCQVKRDMCIFWEGIECPLKPMPDKKSTKAAKEQDILFNMITIAEATGWNDCIDELEGEK